MSKTGEIIGNIIRKVITTPMFIVTFISFFVFLIALMPLVSIWRGFVEAVYMLKSIRY